MRSDEQKIGKVNDKWGEKKRQKIENFQNEEKKEAENWVSKMRQEKVTENKENIKMK